MVLFLPVDAGVADPARYICAGGVHLDHHHPANFASVKVSLIHIGHHPACSHNLQTHFWSAVIVVSPCHLRCCKPCQTHTCWWCRTRTLPTTGTRGMTGACCCQTASSAAMVLLCCSQTRPKSQSESQAYLDSCTRPQRRCSA